MLQCDKCLQWFHLECIRSTAVPRTMLLGDTFYEFVCTVCTGTCEEEVTRLDLNWADALHLTLFNLTILNNNKYHDLDTSILPFLKRRWKTLQGPSCLLKMNRLDPEFIKSLLSSRNSRFRCGSESKKQLKYWGLCQIAPPGVSCINNVYSTTTIRAKDSLTNSRTVGVVPTSSSSYSIKQQRRPAMKSSSELNTREQNLASSDHQTPTLNKPLKPFVLKLNTPSTNGHINGLKNSYKNSLLAIKEPYPCGSVGRKISMKYPINGVKGQKMDSSNNGSFLEHAPAALSSENPFEIGSRGLLGGYEFNNGWRNFKAIMRKHIVHGNYNKNNNIGSLDTFIPRPKNFDGYNNPFRSFNQDPPILFPQTTLTSYDLFPNYSGGKYGLNELNRRQRRLFRRSRHSLLSSRKNSINSSGGATPERDMDCSSSCSNSVDENVNFGFLNPPPLLDINEPLYLAPPSPPSSMSKMADASQNEKSPPTLDLFPPPLSHTNTTTLPGESGNVTSHNNNKPTTISNGTKKPSNLCSISNIKSIKQNKRDLKCPLYTMVGSDGPANDCLNTNRNVLNKNENLRFSLDARRLTLDGDIQYLFDWDDRGTSCKEETIIKEDVKEDVSTEHVLNETSSNSAVSSLKRETSSPIKAELPDPNSEFSSTIFKEETFGEEIKKEPIIDLDSSLSAATELPANNTATTFSPTPVVLD